MPSENQVRIQDLDMLELSAIEHKLYDSVHFFIDIPLKNNHIQCIELHRHSSNYLIFYFFSVISVYSVVVLSKYE